MASLMELAQQHTATYENLYNEMNPQGKSVIPAQEAAAFMKRSNLSVNVLGQIWELADYNKRGYLDKNGAFIVLKLIAACQQGHSPSTAVLSMSLDPPSLASRCATPSIPNFGGYSMPDKWTIGPTDQAKYDSIFDSLNPIDGKVPGAKVRPVLMNSGLPGASLAKIWELSDLDKDGQLDRVEMSIALHLVYRALQGDTIPAALPSSLLRPSMISPIVPPPSALHRGGRRSRTGSVASLDAASTSSISSGFQGAPIQPRSQSVQPAATSTPTHPMGPMASLNPLLGWPVQSTRYEQQFRKADSNCDGLVSGADIRDDLLKTGLPQTTLARLWALADIKKTGMLNLEQYSLIMHLIEQCRQGSPVPPALPQNLIPPSMRSDEMPSLAGLQLSQDSISTGNEELDAIQRDIRNLIDERREADQAIVQFEADITVKNSEIKNLQIELTTLENTVAQLERQKIEAGKRLDALDNQIAQLERNEAQLKEKLQDEEARLAALRAENIRNRENAAKEAEQMARMQQEVYALEKEKNTVDSAFAQRNSQIEMAANQLTEMEGQVASMEEQKKQIDAENDRLKKTAERLKYLIDSSDVDTLMKEQADLLCDFPAFSPQVNGKTAFSSVMSPSSAVDPFAGSAHMGGGDPFGGDPFASTSSSTFAAFDEPFGSHKDPFGASADPFSSGAQSASALSSSKSPPPRPAPPKARQTPVANAENDPFSNNDPFSSSAAPTTSGAQFADFANFAAFS